MEGTPFGRYRLVEMLGRGGMGEVWRAYDTEIDRVVALKVLPPQFLDDEVFQARFRREARAAAGLDEPHVVPIYDVGEIDGRLFLTMRLIKGRDLEVMLKDGPLDPARAVGIIEQIASALNAAHRIQLVHRDVKPSNILVAENDFAYLIDFGIARTAGETGLTNTGATIGTWGYMAPERFSTGVADAAADTYALACVLHQALTGEQPFPNTSLEQIVAAHMMTPPPQPSRVQTTVPTQLDHVIATGMAKNPADRYPTTRALGQAAREALIASRAVTVPTPRPPAPRPPRYEQPYPQHPRPPVSADATVHRPPWSPPVHPVAPQLPSPPPAAPPDKRNVAIIGGAAAAVVVIIVVAVVALLHSRGGDVDSAAPTAGTTSTAEFTNSGPFTGVFDADFGPTTRMDGASFGDKALPGGKESWAVRSVCKPNGCVATATRMSGQIFKTSPLVLDDINGSWVGVATGPGSCVGKSTEKWDVLSLQPKPDGTLVGELMSVTPLGCSSLRTASFRRTADVSPGDGVANPGGASARVASPALALHGRYRKTVVAHYKSGSDGSKAWELSGRTGCLRSGDRCITVLSSPDSQTVMVFGNSSWTQDDSYEAPCTKGGTSQVHRTAQFPLPQQPVPDPIALLIGQGHDELSGSNCPSSDTTLKLERLSD